MLKGGGALLLLALIASIAYEGPVEERRSDDSVVVPQARAEVTVRQDKTDSSQETVGANSEPGLVAGSRATDETWNLQEVSLEVRPGDTLSGLLLAADVPSSEIDAASRALGETYDLRALRPGQKLTLSVQRDQDTDAAVCLQRLQLRPETDRILAVRHVSHSAFEVEETTVAHSRTIAFATGEIRANLFQAAEKVGVPIPILFQMFQVLSYRLDFQRDLQPGDTFRIGFEQFDDGERGGIHAGELLYAALDTADETISIYRHETRDGFTGYFDDTGASVETSLMKTPVDGARLSSLFGKRKHPILSYTRMHRGLDFAAPRGTPVLAAGDATVVRVGRNGSFGNYIRLKHDSTYQTAYAHLSRYATGLQKGGRVQQGEVIGYVGQTGLATGPNLHYEVLENGDQVDPLTLDLPPRRTLEGDELVRFEQAKAQLEIRWARSMPDGGARQQAQMPGGDGVGDSNRLEATDDSDG